MTAWTTNVIGLGGEGKYPAADGKRKFREPLNMANYDLYVDKTAQANGIITHLYVPKGLTIAASDTQTVTIKAA
jgi:hypothetical protein